MRNRHRAIADVIGSVIRDVIRAPGADRRRPNARRTTHAREYHVIRRPVNTSLTVTGVKA